ncbi:MAG TPA: ATP-binding protein [Tepidisphaeraceae bacterium]|jgi:signal transduction histidine kinase|nr:ATP-binding protein [Tepidisphaeraceae bacterium]
MWKNVVAPTLLVIAFWGLSTIATAYYISWLESVPARMVMEDLATIHAADNMRHALGQINRTMALAPRPVLPKVSDEVKRLEGEFLKSHAQAVATANSPGEAAVDVEILKRFEEVQKEVDRQINHGKEAPFDREKDIQSLLRLIGSVSDEEVILGEMNEKEMKDLANSGSTSQASLSRIRYGLLIVGPVAGLLCGFWISMRFRRSISRISITLDDVASEMREHVGNVEVRAGGELPRLAEQVDVVVERIRAVVSQLHEARRQAIGAARLAAVGEMAAGIAHELRNPLTSVKLLIQTSAQRPGRSLTERQFSVVLEEISRMETTIERMLDFARPPRIYRSNHDLCQIVQRALSVYESRAHEANVELVGDLPDCPLQVNGDAEQLHQVFSNVIQNGIEAMSSGGILRVRVEADGLLGVCRVVFEDAGPGISAEVMSRLFQPFVTDKARGTGLGLAVSDRIVRDHEGSLTAINRPEGGAEFTVILPTAVSALRDAVELKADAVPVHETATSDTMEIHAQAAHH